MSSGTLVDLVLHGREERNLEYKQSLHWSVSETRAVVRAKLTKSILAMANVPDGGAIVIGLRKDGEQYVPDGMPPAERDSFTQDGVAAHVNEFASPNVELSVSREAVDGRDFVVIQVRAFVDTPVVCRKDGAEGLRRGAIYTRARRMNETVEVPTEAEMREILDRATEHRVRAMFALFSRAGVPIAGLAPAAAAEDRTRFEDQLHGL